MKLNSRILKTVLVLLGVALGRPTKTEALVWWPEAASVTPEMTIYQDYDDKNSFYFVPNQMGISVHDQTGAIMINHGIFFDRLSPKNSTTQYNLTFEPRLKSGVIDAAVRALKAKYGLSARLSPLPITTVSFSVTQRNERDAQQQFSSPFSVFVPQWTGDLHSFHQRFSVSMLGSLLRAEPAMSRFMTNPAGNAFVGTLHYGFRAIHRVFDGYMKVNVKQFHSKLSTHFNASGFFSSVDIKAAIEKLKNDQSVIVDVQKDKGYESQVWNALVDKLIRLVFEPVPALPSTLDSPHRGGSLFSFRSEYQKITDEKILRIDLKEALIENHSGDIDVVGGALKPESLDPNIKFICDYWSRFSRELDRCEPLCEPFVERWDNKTKSCVNAFEFE